MRHERGEILTREGEGGSSAYRRGSVKRGLLVGLENEFSERLPECEQQMRPHRGLSARAIYPSIRRRIRYERRGVVHCFRGES
jgi:hypothetical protein